LGDALGGMDVLAAGKAMRKQGVSARLANGAIEQRGELLSLRVGKIKTLSRHDLLPLDRGAFVFSKAQQDLRTRESARRRGEPSPRKQSAGAEGGRARRGPRGNPHLNQSHLFRD